MDKHTQDHSVYRSIAWRHA